MHLPAMNELGYCEILEHNYHVFHYNLIEGDYHGDIVATVYDPEKGFGFVHWNCYGEHDTVDEYLLNSIDEMQTTTKLENGITWFCSLNDLLHFISNNDWEETFKEYWVVIDDIVQPMLDPKSYRICEEEQVCLV